MTIYALQLETNGLVSFTTNGSLQLAAKLSGTARVRGKWFKDIGDNAYNELFRIWDGSGIKFAVGMAHLFTYAVRFRSFTWPGDADVLDLTTVGPTLNDNGFYLLAFSFDPTASPRCSATLYDTDGTTVLATNSNNGNSNSTALPTGTNYGKVSVGYVGDIGIGKQIIIDYLKIGDPTPTRFDAEFDEGTGSSTIDSVGGPTGTITGTHSWIALPNPPDHGTVTLTPSTIAWNGTGLATVQWYDASNNPVADPGTTWSTIGGAQGATINSSTGAFTGKGAGTCPIRAAYGAIHADAVLTLTRRVTLSGFITVP